MVACSIYGLVLGLSLTNKNHDICLTTLVCIKQYILNRSGKRPFDCSTSS